MPKDDSGLSISEAVYCSPLTVPGEFLRSTELPPTSFLCKIENPVAGFAIPPLHQLLPALLMAKFVLVRKDAFKKIIYF